MFSRSRGLDALLHRKPPGYWTKLFKDPVYFIAQALYRSSCRQLTDPRICASSPVTVVAISDTHNCQIDLPDGDILIHAGDLTQSGSLAEIQAALDWLNFQPHRHKIAIAGNHDLILDVTFPSTHRQDRMRIDWGDVIYLQNDSATVQCSGRSIKVFGSPFSPKHGNWAFQYPRADNIWVDMIPEDLDILITHGPPKGHLDLDRWGCGFLLEALWKLSFRPKLYVFGHIHQGHGIETARFDLVQKAYDDIVLSDGVRPLLLFYLFYAYVRSMLRFGKTSHPSILVNASIVGGLRDETRREAVTVVI